MKDSDQSICRSNKKASGRTVVVGKLSNCSSSSNKSNGTTTTSDSKQSDNKRTKKAKKMMMMGASNSRTKVSDSTPKNSPRKSNKPSPELRPRRRASQTYFFKYQLAKNPLKAEEEDLKLALLASLQQCGNNGTSDNKNCSKLTPDKKSSKRPTNKDSIHLASEGKRPVGRPKGASSLLTENGVETTDNTIYNNNNSTKRKDKFSSPKKGQQYEICANSTNGSNKRRGSVESSLSSRGSSFKDEEKQKKKKIKTSKFDRRRDGLLGSCALQTVEIDSKTEKPRSKVKSSLSSCNDLTSVQKKIKNAKKLLQNKHANKTNKSNAIINKYSALRKFPSNSSPSSKREGGSLLSPGKNADKSKSKSKLNTYYYNNLATADSANTTSRNQYFMSYSPYTPLQRKEPPDEDYLKKYKPETEDFLTFICFRTTAPNYQNRPTTDISTNGVEDTTCTATSNPITSNNRIMVKQVSNDHHNLKQCTSSLSKLTNINNSPTNVDHYSPNNHRRPTRQSPRLASSHRKISENDSSNYNMGTSTTAYDNSNTYEEDMRRASIALEDMAQEINSSDGMNNEVAQNSPDCISKLSSSPYKNNKHLVKGLMTREFAGAFADEETIFESISNHKL